MSDSIWVTGAEFLRKAKAIADNRGITIRFVVRRGKGSHGTLFLGDRFTVVKDLKKDIHAGLFRAMIRQLGLHPEDFR